MIIKPKPKRQRVYAVVAPETMRWLTAQKDRHSVSYGVLIDNLVREQTKDERVQAWGDD